MRYASIDILRTFAIFVMVFVHFAENLAGVTLPFAGFGAPLFSLLSGVSYCLWERGAKAKGKSDEEISKVSVRRGLFVFGLGFVFNVVVWLPEDTFNWDVLTLIGTALLMLNLLRKADAWLLWMLAAAAIFFAPLFRALVDYHAYWVNGYFESDLTLTDVWIGYTVTGYFPLFPWIAYSLIGYTLGNRLFIHQESGRSMESGKPILGAALGLSVFTAAMFILGPYVPEKISRVFCGGWHMFPATIEYVCGTLAGILLLIVGLHWAVDKREGWMHGNRLLAIAGRFSQYSLTIYVLHHVVHLWPLWIYGALQGDDPTEYWRLAMSLPLALVLASLFLLVLTTAFALGMGKQRRGLESLMRWICD